MTPEPAAHPEAVLLERAIGGWRGMIDSGLPSLVFLLVYLLNGRVLQPALLAALGTGVVILVLRLVRKEPLTQVLAGFAGVAISAWVSSRTGQARDFFLWGLIVNVAYGSAFLISLAVRWPLMGVVVGMFMGDPTGWRQDPELRRRFAAATWVWVLLFGSRILVHRSIAEEFIGRFVFTEDTEAASPFEGMKGSPGVVVVQPDTFGQKGKVLAQTDNADGIATALRTALKAFVKSEKETRSHLNAGHREGVFWETKTPVTDPMEAVARERAKKK